MFSALLLCAVAAGFPFPKPGGGGPPDPVVKLRLSDDGRYRAGDRAKVKVETTRDGYLWVLHVDADRHLRVLFPLNPGDDNFVRAGKTIELAGRGGRETFRVADRSGRGEVFAAFARDPFAFDRFTAGGVWDLRALDAALVSRDVEADFTDLARAASRDGFDYDLAGYEIGRHLAYGRPGWGGYYGYPYPWYGPYGGTRIFLGFGGRRRFWR
jgi:hypothetical protein